MATITAQAFRQKLKSVLLSGLAAGGIKAEVEMESIPGTKLTRVLVTARKFKNLRPSERQDLVWRIVEQHFTPDDQLLISMIMTLATNEYAAV